MFTRLRHFPSPLALLTLTNHIPSDFGVGRLALGVRYSVLFPVLRPLPPARRDRYAVCSEIFVTVLFLFALLVLLPAAAAFLAGTSLLARAFIKPAFSVGAPVIYCQEEVSTRPTADARDIRPAARGEYYYYSIINYLRVIEVLADGRIIAVARDNQRRCFRPNDSALRKARLNERLIYRLRFPRV
jgi:hypothetical protein